MGCCRCHVCGEKFEAYDAEEYADSGEEPDYETCPDCLGKEERAAEKEAYVKKQEAELVALRAEVKTLRKKLAASSTIDLTRDDDSDTKPPATKKAKVSGPTEVWVIVKGDWPDHSLWMSTCLVHILARRRRRRPWRNTSSKVDGCRDTGIIRDRVVKAPSRLLPKPLMIQQSRLANYLVMIQCMEHVSTS